MSKLSGILTKDTEDTIISIMGAVQIPDKQMIDLIESTITVIHKYSDRFESYTEEEKLKALELLAITFDTLLDREINPLAASCIMKGIRCFNNNVYEVRCHV